MSERHEEIPDKNEVDEVAAVRLRSGEVLAEARRRKLSAEEAVAFLWEEIGINESLRQAWLRNGR